MPKLRWNNDVWSGKWIWYIHFWEREFLCHVKKLKWLTAERGHYWQMALPSSPLGAAPAASEITTLFLQDRIIGLNSASEAVGCCRIPGRPHAWTVIFVLLPTLLAPLLIASPKSRTGWGLKRLLIPPRAKSSRSSFFFDLIILFFRFRLRSRLPFWYPRLWRICISSLLFAVKSALGSPT